MDTISLSRLRYWLHPSQAPKYGRGFIASEERGCPSAPTRYACATTDRVSHFIWPRPRVGNRYITFATRVP